VITFGVEFPEGDDFGLTGKDSIVHQFDPEKDDMGALQNRMCKLHSGVFGLTQDCRVGVDIRYSTDAYVVLATNKLPDSENVKQTIARGTRSYGPQEGKVFAVGNPDDQDYLERGLKENRGINFHDGARNIKIAKKLLA
jgi:hypothetical protein